MTDNVTQTSVASDKYFIPPEKSLPEITVKVVIIAIVITVLIASANAYLGLKVGLTLSGSIPAAILIMGILRLFKHHNVLENNVGQTAVASGSVIASGIIFTLPATLVIGAWTHIEYWPTVAIAILGGLLGVMFSIPLRRALLDDPNLRFPEGLAIGEVLKRAAGETVGLGTLLIGGAFGIIISIAQLGLRVVSSGMSYWVKAGSSLYGIGLGFSPALIGAGYIVGLSVGMSILIGIILGWFIGIPVISSYYGIPADVNLHDTSSIAYYYWSHYIRYIGIGTNIVGSGWAIISLFKPMISGIIASVHALKEKGEGIKVLRTERDMSIKKVFMTSVVLIIIISAMIMFFAHRYIPDMDWLHIAVIAMISGLLIYGLGFLVAAVCAYFAGLVGSSISPVSCMMLIGAISTSLVLLILSMLWHLPKTQIASMGILSILITAVIAAVASISNDTMQDLKAGQIIGATPWKQQSMLLVGVVVASLFTPLVLELLYQAYGIAGVFPRPDMDPGQMLLAPQANLIAAITQGVFKLSLPWGLLSIGIAIGFLVIIIDRFLKPHGKRLHILGVGMGIYLPFDACIPLVLGGIAAGLTNNVTKKQLSTDPATAKKQKQDVEQRGLLAGCGLVAGAALSGVALAVPFAIAGSSDVWALVGPHFKPYADILGLLSAGFLLYWMYRVATKTLRTT